MCGYWMGLRRWNEGICEQETSEMGWECGDRQMLMFSRCWCSQGRFKLPLPSAWRPRLAMEWGHSISIFRVLEWEMWIKNLPKGCWARSRWSSEVRLESLKGLNGRRSKYFILRVTLWLLASQVTISPVSSLLRPPQLPCHKTCYLFSSITGPEQILKFFFQAKRSWTDCEKPTTYQELPAQKPHISSGVVSQLFTCETDSEFAWRTLAVSSVGMNGVAFLSGGTWDRAVTCISILKKLRAIMSLLFIVDSQNGEFTWYHIENEILFSILKC